jgi:hypothetical protein
MQPISWTELASFELTPRDVFEPWMMATEAVRDATHVRIQAEGSWCVLKGIVADCGPDGHSGLRVAVEHLVLPDCPFGALIGKMGGSSASATVLCALSVAAAATTPPVGGLAAATTPPAGGSVQDGKPFPLGVLCVLPISNVVHGPLFIGFNSTLRPIRVNTLKIRVGLAALTT